MLSQDGCEQGLFREHFMHCESQLKAYHGASDGRCAKPSYSTSQPSSPIGLILGTQLSHREARGGPGFSFRRFCSGVGIAEPPWMLSSSSPSAAQKTTNPRFVRPLFPDALVQSFAAVRATRLTRAIPVVQLGLDSSLSHGIAIKQCNQTVEGPSQIRYGEPDPLASSTAINTSTVNAVPGIHISICHFNLSALPLYSRCFIQSIRCVLKSCLSRIKNSFGFGKKAPSVFAVLKPKA